MSETALDIVKRRAAEAAANRAAFPRVTEMVDFTRYVFGDGVRLRWAEEGGRTLGKLGPPGVQASERWPKPLRIRS